MKEQRIIVELDAGLFKLDVNRLLDDGWHIIPNSLQTSITSAMSASGRGEVHKLLAVALERDVV